MQWNSMITKLSTKEQVMTILFLYFILGYCLDDFFVKRTFIQQIIVFMAVRHTAV